MFLIVILIVGNHFKTQTLSNFVDQSVQRQTVAMSMSYHATRWWRMQMGGEQAGNAVYWGTKWWHWLRSSVRTCYCLEGNGLLATVWSVTSVATEDIPDDVRDVAQSWPESLLHIHTMNCMLFTQRGVYKLDLISYFNDQLTSSLKYPLDISRGSRFCHHTEFRRWNLPDFITLLYFSLFKTIVWTRQHSIGLCQWNIIRSET